MVWGLADLEGTELGVFLFDEAYDAHWKQAEGAIVALLNATLLPATEKNKFAFKVTCAAEVVVLGTAADFGICKGTSAGDARCRLAVNTARVSPTSRSSISTSINNMCVINPIERTVAVLSAPYRDQLLQGRARPPAAQQLARQYPQIALHGPQSAKEYLCGGIHLRVVSWGPSWALEPVGG